MALIHHPQPTNQTEGNWFSIFKKYQNTKMKYCAVFPLQKLEIYIKTFRMRAHNVSEVEEGNFKQIQFGETISETRETFQFLDLNRTGDKTQIFCVSA